MKKLYLTLGALLIAVPAYAVDITISIPVGKATKATEAICANGYYNTLPDINDVDGDLDTTELLSSAQTCSQFAKDALVNWIKEQVIIYNRSQQRATAEATAATLTQTDNSW